MVIAVEPDFTGGPPEAFDFSSAESTRRFYSSASAELEKRTRDLLHVADSLPELRAGVLADGKFAARINPEWVGVAGFSFGGAVAAEALRRDPRLRAGADLDGTLFGEAATAGAQQPFLFVTDALLAPSPEALASANDAERRLAEFFAKSRDDIRSWLATHGGWLARWTTAQHGDFAPPTGGRGNNRQILAQVDSLVADFFRQAYHDRLNEFPSGGIPPWPDFEFSHHPAHSE